MRLIPSAALAAAALCSVAACGHDSATTQVTQSSVLLGLSNVAGRDSAGNPPPAPPSQVTTPGSAHGTVLGQSPAGAGNDSLLTAPKISGARVAAFPVTGGSSAAPTLGAEAAAVFTGSDGKFSLPTLPGGPYVVTFTPPAGSIYHGVWVTAMMHATSNQFPWWVVLGKK